MYCTKCGSELPEGVKHCFVCGAAVRQLPPLQTFSSPAGQNTSASPLGQPQAQYRAAGQPQNRPAYQSPAYQTPQSQPLPRPTWPPRPENDAASPAPSVAYTAGTAPASPAYHYPAYHHNPAAGTPDTVSMLDWLFSTLLVLFVPVIRVVMLCVWAFGSGAKPSKRSWARAMLILYLVLFLFFVGWNVYLAMTGQLSFEP